MRLFLLALTLLTLSLTEANAARGITARAASASIGTETNSVAPRDVTVIAPASDSSFAQFDTTGRAPLSSSVILTLVVAFVVTLRLMGLNRARSMADHERSTYHGKAQMFRSLQEERSGRR